MSLWTVPQLQTVTLGKDQVGYTYRIRYGVSENPQNSPIHTYYDLKLIERTKTEARVFLQDGTGGPWVLLSGFDLSLCDGALGMAAVNRLRLLRGEPPV